MTPLRAWKWPLVRRSTHEAEVADLCRTIRDRDRQLARLGHRVVEVKREDAKLLTDLRLVRIHIEYPSLRGDKIGFSFEMHGAVFDSYRHNPTFVELLAYMVEKAMYETPEGRATLAGLYTGGP